jgi:hypothetical protein
MRYQCLEGTILTLFLHELNGLCNPCGQDGFEGFYDVRSIFGAMADPLAPAERPTLFEGTCSQFLPFLTMPSAARVSQTISQSQ